MPADTRIALPGLGVLLAALACSSDTPPAQPDAGLPADAAAIDRAADRFADVAPDLAPDAAQPIPAAEYCERVAAGYCSFYRRCGRIASDSQQACEAAFLPTCNARYEPVYAALVAAGLLELSAAGLATCLEHLATVECARQIRDLDGACSGMWRGLQPADQPCGVGIESLVCAPGSACALTLELCGTCKPVAAEGAPCGTDVGTVCGAEAECADGRCRARAQPGEPCSDAKRCVIGARCEGTCRAPDFVGVGASCDTTRRCQHRLTCVGGQCAPNVVDGEPCDGATPCESGRCAAGQPRVCAPRLPAGEPCGAPADCLSAACVGDRCAAIPGHCFAATP